MGSFLKKLLIDFLAGLLIAAAIASIGGLFQSGTLTDTMRILSDGFFVAAAALLTTGGMTWTINGGVMDGLGFAVKVGIARIRRDYDAARVTFAEYRQQRHEKASSPAAILVAGVIHLAVAFLFLAVYNKLI